MQFAIVFFVVFLWKSLFKLKSDFSKFQSKTDVTLASLITVSRGEFATYNSPLAITKKGHELLNEIGSNEFLENLIIQNIQCVSFSFLDYIHGLHNDIIVVLCHAFVIAHEIVTGISPDDMGEFCHIFFFFL